MHAGPPVSTFSVLQHLKHIYLHVVKNYIFDNPIHLHGEFFSNPLTFRPLLEFCITKVRLESVFPSTPDLPGISFPQRKKKKKESM